MYHVDLDPPARTGRRATAAAASCTSATTTARRPFGARLGVLRKSTAPLTASTAQRGLLREVDGTGSTAEVLERILAQLGRGATDGGSADPRIDGAKE